MTVEDWCWAWDTPSKPLILQIWELYNGPVPEGKYIRRKCKTSSCINPTHYTACLKASPHKNGDPTKPISLQEYKRKKARSAYRCTRFKELKHVVASENISLDTGPRPKTRADCLHGPRPCPWVGCRYNLFLEVHPTSGSVIENFDDPSDMKVYSCALDAADHNRGGMTLDEIGKLLGVTRERTRQIESKALLHIRKLVELSQRFGRHVLKDL